LLNYRFKKYYFQFQLFISDDSDAKALKIKYQILPTEDVNLT